MSVFDERFEYQKNPTVGEPEYGDFTPFYVTVTVCTILGVFLFILNIAFGCCSRYSEYWNERHTGNRWIVSLWTATPHKQPPVDLTELETISVPQPRQVVYEPQPQPEEVQYLELRKRESEI